MVTKSTGYLGIGMPDCPFISMETGMCSGEGLLLWHAAHSSTLGISRSSHPPWPLEQATASRPILTFNSLSVYTAVSNKHILFRTYCDLFGNFMLPKDITLDDIGLSDLCQICDPRWEDSVAVVGPAILCEKADKSLLPLALP